MLSFDFRPGARLFNQIARLEYLSGSLRSHPEAGAEQIEAVLDLDSAFFLSLDGSLKALESLELTSKLAFGERLPEQTLSFLRKSPDNDLVKARQFLSCPPRVTSDSLLLAKCCEKALTGTRELGYPRKTRLSLSNTCGYSTGSFLFRTLDQAVVERRFSQLLSWYSASDQNLHPIIRASIFHLGLLQISPFERLNQFVALALYRSELIKAGYESLNFLSLGHLIYLDHERYFSSIKQAERTSPGSCTTLNIWLEFSLSVLVNFHETLLNQVQQVQDIATLPATQLKIVKIVEKNGSATREQIAQETGINPATVKYSLSQLAAKGILKKFGGGRSTSYAPGSATRNPELED